MNKSTALYIFFSFLIILNLIGCTFSNTEITSTTETISPKPSNTPTIETSLLENNKSYIVSADDLQAITGVSNYEYSEFDNDVIGGIYWSQTSAMFTIEFKIFPNGTIDLFEDYRTSAKVQTQSWIDSSSWDTAVFYYIDEWDAETIALFKDDLYVISFIPEAYSTWDPAELGANLLELLISTHLNNSSN